MSNIVEFVVRMRDQMSGGLGKLGATSQSTFSRLAQHADRMNQRNRILGQSYDQLQSRIREVENTIRTSTITSQISAARRELASLQRQTGSHQGNISGSSSGGGGLGVGGVALGSMIGNVGMQAATAFLGAVKDGIGSAISGSIQKEKDLVGLSTFIGKEGANVAYKNIRQDAQESSYDTASLLKANRALISVDGNAKNAREDVMNLANAISATGGGNDELQRMSINMQQIKSLGKASSMDIKQFGYAGINIYALLSKATGKSMEEVKKMDVTYDVLAKSLAMARSKGGLYEGALEAQNATKGGRWEAMKDKASNTLTDIGDAMSPIIIQFLDLGTKALSYVAPAIMKITPYIEMISNGLAIAISYVSNLGNGTGSWGDYLEIAGNWISIIWDYQKKLWTSLVKIIAGVADWVGKSEILKDTFRLIGWILENVVGPVVSWIGDSLLWVWENVLQPILTGIEQAYKWVKELVTGDKITIDGTISTNPNDKPSPPTPPGYAADLTRFKDKGGLIGDTESKSKKNKESSKKAGDTISGGGPRVINITLGKFFETIQFTTMNNNESREELEKLLMEMMGRVLFNGGKLA